MDYGPNGRPGPDPAPPGRNGADPSPEADSLNPELTVQETVRGAHAGDQYVRVEQPYGHLFHHVAPGYLRATDEVLEPRNVHGRLWRGIKRLAIGSPLATEREIHERLSKVKALAIFASDAISSVAYAGEEILFILMVAGSSALVYSVPISIVIAVLLSIVAFSYRQTVFAYPSGGGSYVVAGENINAVAGLVAAAALMLDYVLTVAVSISSGTDAVTSAFPVLKDYTVGLSLLFIAIVTLGNLRGVRESGTIFAIPTYAFIFGLGGLIVMGIARVLTGAGPVEPVQAPVLAESESLSLWLLLTAFSAGSVAMSGTEAISNGVPAFKPPESKNAATTLTVMAGLLAFFFVSISVLAFHFGIVPAGNETVLSQLGRAIFGRNGFYYLLQFGTMGILVVAANTSFAGFPRLSYILANDDYMPHSFSLRGDRLAFSTGILALGSCAGLLVIAFQGDTHLLIPLYAIGVFLAFTMAQAGMVKHWLRLREPGWRRHMAINGIGAVLTALVLVIAGITKFERGAWIIIVAIPILVVTFLLIHRHYAAIDEALKLTPARPGPTKLKMSVLVVVPSVNYATQRALAFARTISANVTAVTVAYDRAQAARVREHLRAFDPDIKSVVLEDPYRTFYAPLLTYVEALHACDPESFITIVLPEFIVRHWWETFLHNRSTRRLNELFRKHPNIAVVNVPYLIEDYPNGANLSNSSSRRR